MSSWQMIDGLPYPSVAALAQSSDGYLWIGTRTGLGRFDGVNFTTYTGKNLPQLTSDRITSFCETADGSLWVGTGKGIACYRDGVWSRPTQVKSVDEGDVYSLFQESDGSILINCITKLFRLRDGRVEELTLQGGAAVPRLNSIQRVSNGDVFLAGNGLVRETDGALLDVSAEAGMVRAWIPALAAGPSGSLWLGTRFGLVSWDGKQRRTFTTRDGLPSNAIRSLLIDRDANLWVGTTNGLARYAKDAFRPLLISGVEPMSHVLSLYEDRERNLWVGTDNGLFRVHDVKVANLTQRDGLPINSVLCVLQAKDGTRWVGTFGGGLAHITADGIQTFRVTDGMVEDGVNALAEDNDGGLWIAYYTGGVSCFKNGKFTHYSPGDGTLRTVGLGVDRQGTIWASDARGLYRLAKGKFEPIPFANSPGNWRALHIDPAGGVWLGSPGIVGRFYEGKWTVYPTPKGLPEQIVQCIFSGANGDIWILHDGPGLGRIRDGQRTEFPFPVEIGPLIYSGFEYQNELWVNFRAGVARIPLGEFDAVAAGRKTVPGYVLYSEPDGMRSRAPNVIGSPGAAPMSDGSLWFSTSAGIAIIDPARIRTNPLSPNVVIEHVFADKRELPLPELARIPPGRGELEFQFTALSLVNPAQVHFKYRLRGFEDDWKDAGRRREANYGGLRAGAYRFEVIACNNEGVWNTTGATCELVLLPHYYERWWFYGALGLILGGATVGTYKWRSRHLKRRAANLQRQNVELERRIAERTAELAKSNAAIRASEYFYHSLVESLPQIIVRKDAEGRFTYANAAYGELIGHSGEEIVGRTDRDIYPPEQAAQNRADDLRVMESGQVLEYENVIERPGQKKRYLQVKKVPLFAAQQPIGVLILFWDMTVFRETEELLRHAQQELIETSRLAGIAEVATGVLHNLGNALNSVNTSATIAADCLRESKVPGVGKVAQLLLEQGDRLAEFFATDPRGRQLPAYLEQLAALLQEERSKSVRELEALQGRVDHIKQIVAAQQSYVHVSGIVEVVPPAELVEFALRISEASLARHGVTVVRKFSPAPPVKVERHKVMQILLNLIRNAKEAIDENRGTDKQLVLGIGTSPEGRAQIYVTDNGVGIVPENLIRVFVFGFTTKVNGRGFGLHTSANAAKEMGGSLEARSEGPGKGATFVLELPPAG